MKKGFEIREYTSQDQQSFKKFYSTIENKKKQSQVLHALVQSQRAKRTWQAGIVGVIGIHMSQWIHGQLSFSSIPTIFLELILWSTGLGFVWYKLLCREYENKVRQAIERIPNELASIQKNEKSNAWVMVNNENEIVGTVALKFENGEGKIGYLTGQESQTRLQLVQNAFRFGRTNKIQVISKWGHEDSKWSESCI